MEKSDSEIFRSCQPVWNTHVVTIFWGDNLAIIFNGSNFSSAHLAKWLTLTFQPHFKRNRHMTKLLALRHASSFACIPITYALFGVMQK